LKWKVGIYGATKKILQINIESFFVFITSGTHNFNYFIFRHPNLPMLIHLKLMALPDDPWTRLYPLMSYSISSWRRGQTPLDSPLSPFFIRWFYVDFLTLVLIIFDLSWFFHTLLFLQCYVIVNHLPSDVTFAHIWI
jgi:hypothetical protein